MLDASFSSRYRSDLTTSCKRFSNGFTLGCAAGLTVALVCVRLRGCCRQCGKCVLGFFMFLLAVDLGFSLALDCGGTLGVGGLQGKVGVMSVSTPPSGEI